MDLALSEDDLRFRESVREFLAESIPAEFMDKEPGDPFGSDGHRKWHKILFDRGWIAPSWPVEAGGAALSPVQRYLLDRELARAPVPMIMPFNIGMVGPVIRKFGTDEQKSRFLPSILDGSAFWCQGFSEPGAGSDLAAVRTRAVRDGEDYVVNGQKIWTSYAHWADWIFCLVRTDAEARQQDGISFLLIDMKTPGITVRPIETIDNHHHLNEIFFADVRVPVANRVGEENRGWTYAKYLLGHERTGLTGVAETQEALKALRNYLASSGGPLAEDAAFRRRLGAIETRLKALEITELRFLTGSEGEAAGAVQASILKMEGSHLQQAASELAVEALGYGAARYGPEGVASGAPNETAAYVERTLGYFFFRRAATIYGGSDEVQRSIISKQYFGL